MENLIEQPDILSRNISSVQKEQNIERMNNYVDIMILVLLGLLSKNSVA